MPKKILFESAVHQLAMSGKRLLTELQEKNPTEAMEIKKFTHSWMFTHLGKKGIKLSWAYPTPGEREFDFEDASFYFRGDSPSAVEKQREEGILFRPDEIQGRNQAFFDSLFQSLREQAFSNKNALQELA
jgi:hypothetical protein